jgi:hypothetical protein
MIKPANNQLFEYFFDLYLKLKFKQRFSSINIYFPKDFETEISQKSVLLIGNHISWWDGFLGRWMNRKIFKKKFHVVMLESTLSKHKFFTKLGAFSINPGSKTVIESLRFSAKLLENQQNMLQFFPQGKLHSIYEDNPVFNNGIQRIISPSLSVCIIFYASFIENGSFEKPYINIFLKILKTEIGNDLKLINEQYNTFYVESKNAHIQMFRS